MVSKFKDIIVHFPGVMIIHQKIPSHEVGRHTHDEHEFFLPLQGEIKVEHNHKFFKAGPGRMLYVPPKIGHRFSSSNEVTTKYSPDHRLLCLQNKLELHHYIWFHRLHRHLVVILGIVGHHRRLRRRQHFLHWLLNN